MAVLYADARSLFVSTIAMLLSLRKGNMTSIVELNNVPAITVGSPKTIQINRGDMMSCGAELCVEESRLGARLQCFKLVSTGLAEWL